MSGMLLEKLPNKGFPNGYFKKGEGKKIPIKIQDILNMKSPKKFRACSGSRGQRRRRVIEKKAKLGSFKREGPGGGILSKNRV